ncbi:DUF1748-domain-containing protein [Melanogaster broomeanus]|nr:DUF1748-domain-containing protein [Melanogaster broomeanus]
MFGKLFHLGFDALLISAFLAGVRRSTGLTPALSQVPNKDIRREATSGHISSFGWLRLSFLFLVLLMRKGAGEYAFDFAVVFFGRSSSFERKP